MGTLGGIISSISSLAAKLLPETSSSDKDEAIKKELNKLMTTLERIKATLYDAEEREIRDRSVKLWLKELKEVAYTAEDVLSEYNYEVLRTQVESRGNSAESSPKRKKVELPDDLIYRINETMSRFDEIASHRVALQLQEDDGPRCYNDEMRIAPTSHMVDETNIFGRENEKEDLIGLLCSDSNNGNVVSVVSIVGTGGIGKTTLAQLVYNDPRIRQKFDLLGWVCVSEDFSVERLTRDVIESIKKGSCGIHNHSVLQEVLKEEIKDKNLFIVLDDVWNEKTSLWELFRIPFLSANSVQILMTTRNEPVAQIMQTIPSFKIQYLSEKQCWQLFQQHAFGGVNCNEEWKLETGKLIMNKCGMLPLAVKSIASLLRHEANEESWREILESELWQLDYAKKIFPPLQISYSRLPAYLKPCLLYCSMFPKDYKYDVEELSQLWFAQGYIESKGRKTIKEIGEEYIEQLKERSFFDNGGCLFGFKLHDMIHDLARSNSGNECYSIEYGKPVILSDQICNLYVEDNVEIVKSLSSCSFRALRTLIMGPEVKKFAISSGLTHALRAVVLKSEDCGFKFLNSIDNMKHLRYISLEWFAIKTLPQSISSFYNLQILAISSCIGLTELPNDIENLVSLKFLYLSHCCLVQRLPESICNLKYLKELSVDHCPLSELPEHIGNIASLENIVLKYCAITILPGSFCQLRALRKLHICGSIMRMGLKELSLEMGSLVGLEILNLKKRSMLPVSHCQLKNRRKLIIVESAIKELPCEMENLTNLETLVISKTGVSSLPPFLNKLTRIQKLQVSLDITMGNNQDEIGWLNNIINLKGTLCITGLNNMTSLAYASLMNKHKLERLHLAWKLSSPPVNIRSDGSLLALNILNSGNDRNHGDEMGLLLLESLQPHPNLKKIELFYYPGITFPNWIRDPLVCASLEKVFLFECPNLTSLQFSNLHNLKHLILRNCHSLQFLQHGDVPSQLQKLEIEYCVGLKFVPGIQKLKSLVKLEIRICPNLKSLLKEPELSPEMTMHRDDSFDQNLFMGLRNHTSLRSLSISYCKELQVMVDELLPVESCKVEIRECDKLREWCYQHNIRYFGVL